MLYHSCRVKTIRNKAINCKIKKASKYLCSMYVDL